MTEEQNVPAHPIPTATTTTTNCVSTTKRLEPMLTTALPPAPGRAPLHPSKPVFTTHVLVPMLRNVSNPAHGLTASRETPPPPVAHQPTNHRRSPHSSLRQKLPPQFPRRYRCGEECYTSFFISTFIWTAPLHSQQQQHPHLGNYNTTTTI